MAKRVVWICQGKAGIRSIEQPIVLQILKPLGRYLLSREGRIKQFEGVELPMIRLRSQNHRVFFLDHAGYLEIARVLDRKEAYRDRRGDGSVDTDRQLVLRSPVSLAEPRGMECSAASKAVVPA